MPEYVDELLTRIWKEMAREQRKREEELAELDKMLEEVIDEDEKAS